MRGAERVVDVDVAVGGELLGEHALLGLERLLGGLVGRLVLAVLLLALGLLLLVVAGVLEDEHVAVLEGRDLGVRRGAVGREGDGLADLGGEGVGDDLHRRVGGDALLVGAAHVGHEDQLAAVLDHVLDRGEGADDEGVDLLEEVLDDRELVGDLGAAEDRRERADGVLDRVAEVSLDGWVVGWG